MALKFEIAKLEEVEEQHRSLYVEHDGKFRLDVGELPEPKTDEQLARELAESRKKVGDLEKDLHRARSTKTSAEEKAAAAEKAAQDQKAAVRELLKKAGLIDGDADGDQDADIKAKLAEIEERQRKAEIATVQSQRDVALIEAAFYRAVAGKASDPEYALFRARSLAEWAQVKVEDGRPVGIDAVVAKLAETGVLGADSDGGADRGGSQRAPGANRQPDLQPDKRPWRNVKTWPEFVKLPVEVRNLAREKDAEWVKKLEDNWAAML